MSWMLANYGVDFEIDTTPFGPSRTWVPVCDGFDNPSEALNEQIQEYYSLCAKGYAVSAKSETRHRISFSATA